MKTSFKLNRLITLVLGVLILGMSLPASAADSITEIPWEGPTVLPEFIGQVAKAHPLPPPPSPGSAEPVLGAFSS